MSYQVICVCGGYGFPLGSASAARIVMIGRTLASAGIQFRLLHCGPSPVEVNRQRKGVYEGLEFEYTTSVRRPRNAALRMLVYIRAIAGLTIRLAAIWPQRRKTLVHLYVMMGPLNLYIGWLCRLLSIPVCQELCEWWPGVSICTPFTRWLHKKSMFRRAIGVLAISREIEKRAAERAEQVNPRLLIHRLPAIVDFDRFASAPQRGSFDAFVYCGTWLHDIEFVISALAIAGREGYRRKLRIVGGAVEYKDHILSFARARGVPPEDIEFLGCVDEAGLAAAYRSAAALLLPMRDDDQSRTRMPNKLAEYLASGRPVIAGNIGDLTEFLSDGVNAFLAEPGSELAMAEKMIEALRNPECATAIGLAGQAACKQLLDFRGHASGLARFVRNCVEVYNLTREQRVMMRFYSSLRNIVCGSIALCLIAAGYVRRARKKAFAPDVVTSIYFHNPNQKLFERCIRWLKRNGYTFISVEDLLEILYQGKKPPRGAVWLSFDDAYRDITENVVPIVRKYKVPITLFVPTGIVEGSGTFPWLRSKNVRDALTLLQLKEISDYPEISFGSHTVSHAVTSRLDESHLKYELAESKRALETWLRREVKCFAYPVGQFNGKERAILADCGYSMAATTENAFLAPGTDPYLVPRFSIGDNISFPEAVCNLAGVWRPFIDPVLRVLQRSGAVENAAERAVAASAHTP